MTARPVSAAGSWPPGFFPGSGGAVPSSRGVDTLGVRLKEFRMLNYFVALASFLTQRLGRDERGATAVEYGLMVALIAVAIVAAVTLLGTTLAGLFGTVTASL
jgi:pilus assembly protein Flp/PilA